MTTRIGVIGVGYLGQHHARVFSELSREGGDCRLVAVADADEGRAREIAERYGCGFSRDYRQLLEQVDAVSIVTPTTTHCAVALQCIGAGKDVLVEKPITATIEEADALIRASEAAGVVVQVGHLERFNPVVGALTPLIDGPTLIEAERLSPFQGRGTDVDITLDLMIHDLDVILSLAGGAPVKDSKATGARVLTGTIDMAKAWLEFDSGLHAVLTASRIAEAKSRTLTVYQHNAYLVMDYQAMEIAAFRSDGGRIVRSSVAVERKEPLKEELRDFLSCVGTRSRPRVCALTGRNALKLALEIGERIKQEW